MRKIILTGLGVMGTLAITCAAASCESSKSTSEISGTTVTDLTTTATTTTTPTTTAGTTATSTTTMPVRDALNNEFAAYADEIFEYVLGDDPYSWNIFTIDQAAFGHVREDGDKAEWYKYEKRDYEYVDVYNEYTAELENLKSYDYSKLDAKNQIAYDYIEDFLCKYIKKYNPANGFNEFIENEYIDNSGGYVSDFASSFQGYILRNKQDVIDLLDYTASTDEAFKSYIEYAKDKADAGYPYSDYTLGEMTSYLEDVIDDGDDYYLFELSKNKLDACSDFLTTEEISAFKVQYAEALSNSFLAGCDALKTGLATVQGRCTTEGYLQAYGEEGKNYYKYLLETKLGYDEVDVDEYIAYLGSKIDTYTNKINSVMTKAGRLTQGEINTFNAYLRGTKFITSLKEPADMMEQVLKPFAKTIVAELSYEPEIEYRYMDETAASKTSTVAYYTKSALDSTDSEFITLNQTYLGSDLTETLTTLAHEGYPGHLYEYCYTKQLGLANLCNILSNVGHGEGWAMYVEYRLFEYIANQTTDKAVKYYCDYSKNNTFMMYALYAYLDAQINYNGWKIPQVSSYLTEHGLNGSAAENLYKTLIEIPAIYSTYGYGSSYVLDLHTKAKTGVGAKNYDEIAFNQYFMSHGWIGFERLTNLVDTFIAENIVA